ncbi:MAG: helix-turn-helix domain-containing protein [Luteolibacter sp.]
MKPAHIRPEWSDAKDVRTRFGICKSTLYRLCEEGKIRSSSLRERGKKRGKRLFSTDSVAAYIESLATGGTTLDENSIEKIAERPLTDSEAE